MTSEQFSEEIRSQLARKRISVAAVASHLGVCRATVHRRLANENGWPLDDALKTAKFVGICAALVFFDLEEATV